MRHKIITFILVILVLGVIISVTSEENTSNSVYNSIPIDEFKIQCNYIPYDITYNDIAREPDKYKGVKIEFEGKVAQVQESGSDVILRVNITPEEYGIYKDTIWVNYTNSSDKRKILEDDIVDIWGVLNGTKTYTAILGNKITIPKVDTRSIEILYN
jgi:uncharacterized membrane protein YcgQ (UPF0703/DUF1980 family)